MKLVMTLALALVAVAGIAVAAGEKEADVRDVVMQEPGRIQITGTLDSSSPMWNRGYGSGAYSLACAFPLTDSSADGQYYDLFCVESTDQNPIQIEVDAGSTTIGDTTMFLFCDPFNPNTPLLNAVFYDDDDGDGLTSAFTLADNIMLPPGTDYWLVLSTFSGGVTGNFTLNTSDNVILCGGVPIDNHDWTTVKGLFR